MSELQQAIIAALRSVPTTEAATLAQDMGEDYRAVQKALHVLDDSGHVILRNGFYRLSEAAKMGRLPEPGVKA